MQSKFGPELKNWREVRRFSQLDLALVSDVSARHISFLETGRARPSRDMVLRLVESLDVPRSSRNAMLHAAGFAPVYQTRSFQDADMSMVREALDWIMSRHDPYPAFMLDRHWMVLNANVSGTLLLTGAGLTIGDGSLLDLFGDPERLSEIVENWEEVARYMTVRLRTESDYLGGDSILEKHIEKLTDLVGRPDFDDLNISGPVVPTVYRAGGMRLSFFSTMSQFSSTDDIALADIKIEHLFPADEATREILLKLAQ